ncbi:hypothetical protein GS507_25980 [Rhodococcus hoagii]|nr:hypothetical protein [Prescottella equi]
MPPMTNWIAVGLDVHGRRLDVDDEPSTRGKVAVHRFERSQGAVAIRQKSERSVGITIASYLRSSQ